MKIAVSGSAGIGKSSLAKAISEKLGLPLIAENYEALFDNPDKFNKPDLIAAQILKIFSTKHQLEAKYDSFITDRCSIDLFHFWMKIGLWIRQKETDQLYDTAIQQAGQYDLIVLPPCGLLQISSDHEAGDARKRSLSPHVQQYNHASIAGLAIQWVPIDRLLFLPNIKQSIDERVEEVMKKLRI